MTQEIAGANSEMVSWPPAPMRCKMSELEFYDVLIADLSNRGPGGQAKRVCVLQSSDGGRTRVEIPLRLTWGARWEHWIKGVGGDIWPPRGEDVENASVKNGRLTFRYSTIFQPNKNGTVSRWEAEYWPEKRRWTVRLLEYF